jgi:NADH:ubiquinone oxidoreductase subunit K
MRNPLRSEGEAFRLLVWVVAVAAAIIVLALVVQAIT